MAINQKQVLSLQQKLSPQQIQMIKLLELPTVQLEQRIKQEIEDNIVLEEEDRAAEDEEQPQQISVDEYLREDDTPSYKSRINNYSKDDKQRPVFLTEGRSLQEYLIEQLGFRNLSEREMKLAVYLVGSIDEDGYLRRDLESVADDIAFTMGLETTAGELERLRQIDYTDEEALIIDEVILLTSRERQLLESIQKYQDAKNGLSLDGVTRRTVESEGVKGSRSKQVETTTRTRDVFDVIQKLQAELTKVQKEKRQYLSELRILRAQKAQMPKEDNTHERVLQGFSDEELRALIRREKESG